MTGKVTKDFWRGKRVFITGHTGFKGSWLSLMLQSMGSTVKGYALAPPTDPALFIVAKVEEGMESEIGDIRDYPNLQRSMTAFNPDILLHLAAQPLVRLSYNEPLQTYMTNVIGTAHVLEAARSCGNLRAIVSVTTDKCYENKEWPWGYRENEPMGGYDPYSSSKGCAELLTSAYRRSFFYEPYSAAIATARAGNVIGGGDWALDRLVPDAIKAFESGQRVIIRNPLAVRPWQHVLEPLSGYLVLAEALYLMGHSFAEAWNFGPVDQDCVSVEFILDALIAKWGNGVAWELNEEGTPHEAHFLKLDCSKAATRLHWYPKWHITPTLQRIVNWQAAYRSGANMMEYCLQEIKTYQTEATKQSNE